MPFETGPSARHHEWIQFSQDLHRIETPAFAKLVMSEPPGVAVFQLESFINNLYYACMMRRRPPYTMYTHAGMLSRHNDAVRAGLSAEEERDVNLALLRLIRRSGCLSLVIGAGVSMEVGAPSWKNLVISLLEYTLTQGRNIEQWREQERDGDKRSFKKEVVETVHLPGEQQTRARALLDTLKNTKDAGDDALQEAAQLCHDLFDQHLFTHLTRALYKKETGDDILPGKTCHAIGRVASHVDTFENGSKFYGWKSVITYNYDDLVGEALDAAGVPRASYAMRGDEMCGDPNKMAEKMGQDADHLGVYHIHGYSPRRLFLITNVKFVFSLSQYSVYNMRLPAIFQHVFANYMTIPLQHCLYLGCSFSDKHMNGLVKHAADCLPGRYHYAVLRWEVKGTSYRDASAEEIRKQSSKYMALGIRPVWVDKHEEIPDLIESLV